MLICYLLSGVLVGMLGFGFALGAGLPVWMAIGIYSGAGVIGMLVPPGLVYLTQRRSGPLGAVANPPV